jgi:FKBP-type peptidyl-prolyl cis-trans isomerase FkpA
MYRLIVIALISLLALPVFAADAPKTEEQKTLYALGLAVSRTLSIFNLSPAELEIVKQGLTDAITSNNPEVDLTAYNDKVQEMARQRRKALGEKLAAGGTKFLESSAKEKGAVKTPSGLVYIPVKEGTGAAPKATDTVKVNYRGTLPNGTEFDSSYRRGQPIEFRLDGVIKCWAEGLQKMKTGGTAKLVCPANLAYGDSGAGELILPGATLAFDVELLEIKEQSKQN